MPIVLYKLDASPPSRAVQMTIDLLSLKVETKSVNILLGEQLKPEYTAKNPLHSIPFMEEGDFQLADSHAIITYLVSRYGADKRSELYPNDQRLRAIVDQRLYFNAATLFPRLRAVTRRFVKLNLNGMLKDQKDDIEDAYNVLEAYLTANTFVAADRFTIADICCVATLSSLNSLVPLEGRYPKIQAWWDRLSQEEWYKNENELGLRVFDGIIKKTNNGQAPAIVDQ